MPTLRELRLRRLWNQRELAQRAGVAYGTVVSAETGRRQPRLVTMRKIAAALGVEWAEVDAFRAALERAGERRARPQEAEA